MPDLSLSAGAHCWKDNFEFGIITVNISKEEKEDLG
jgi:hypothetical protein